MAKYNFKAVERKWQKKWEKKKLYKARDFEKKPKWYSLVEFPYPSGSGLHVGHVRSYTAFDVISRKKRMQGFNVLFPMGWDAFGLPTENYAIKTGIHPEKVTKRNTDTFRKQLKSLGFSFDWSREINTTDPEYYKWTQWIFLQFFKHGLAYKAKTEINWCPVCKIGLANEEVVNGKCERSGDPVEKREKEQWMLKITAYADKLLKGLEDTNYREDIKTQQINWIGRSEGAAIKFKIQSSKSNINDVEVFTTRPDTLFGATYLVLAPEHEAVTNLKSQISNFKEVERYISDARGKTEIDRTAEGKEKTGVELKGVRVINPANGEEIPVFVADYVLGSYGTGAIMAVPAHDERDWDFAKKFGLPIKMVVCPNYPEPKCPVLESAYTGGGHLVDSGEFNGMDSNDAKRSITKFVGGRAVTKYKLRDWVFSRQRYWGEPIPIIHCLDCGYVPVPDKDLPVKLPKVKKYEPTDTGESPLSVMDKWVNTKCPKCKGPAKRETDVMPNWAGSSWYFLRYIDPKDTKKFADLRKLKYWMPVDLYNGGMEHVTLHLLYSRFWNQFLHDLGFVPVGEPYKKRTAHGMILGEGGVKMSKSKGNVINPDDVVNIHGADALRMYEMFIGPFDQAISWDTRSIEGVARFLGRVWSVSKLKVNPLAVEQRSKVENRKLEAAINKTIKKVTEDIDNMSFNTAVSSLMIFVNECQGVDSVPREIWKKFLLILAPFAPHIAEELWHKVGGKKSVHAEKWPEYDPKAFREDQFELLIQVNGKLRGKISVAVGITEDAAVEAALKEPSVVRYVGEESIRKKVFVPGKLINLVT